VDYGALKMLIFLPVESSFHLLNIYVSSSIPFIHGWIFFLNSLCYSINGLEVSGHETRRAAGVSALP
jgi:hypothetical protein